MAVCECACTCVYPHTFGADSEGSLSALCVSRQGMVVERLSGCQVIMEGHERGRPRILRLLELSGEERTNVTS